MIPSSVVAAFAAAAACTILAPAVLLLVLGIKRKISLLPTLLGAAAFFLSQMVLRLPLLQILSTQGWFNAFAAQYLPYVLFLCLTAGLFEESARLGGALLLKKQRSYKDVISFGLGHGLCEVVLLVGASYASNAVLCLTINSGGASVPGLESVIAQLASVNPLDICWGILERVSSVIFHIFATVLVFKGVTHKKIRYYFLAILAHAAVNLMSVVLARFAGIAVSEIALLAAAAAMGVYIRKRAADFIPNPTEADTPA